MTSRALPMVTLITITITVIGCRKVAPPAPPAEASSLPPIKVHAKARMLFTYAESGAFHTVSELGKVPARARGWVRVVDLTMGPEQRRDHELVYVAKLTEPRPDGTYTYVVLSRGAFETLAVNRSKSGADAPTSQPAGPAPSGGKAGVILYSTSWCPACRAARQHLTEQRIPFVEKDIEKDSRAADELMQKAQAQGISASGVPVLDVNGTLMQGFDPGRLGQLLGGK